MKDNNRRYQYWKWRIILATMICYLFYYCGRFNLSICVGVIADEFGFSNKWVGLLSSSLILTYGIGQFINGNLGDRFGRLLMPIGAVVSCVCNWIFSFTPNISKATLSLMGWTNLTSVVFATMLVMWGINGYFQAMGMAPGGRLISNWWSHKERGLAMGLYTGAAGMSNVTIFLLASWLAGGYGWRAAFRYPPLLMAVVAVVFYLITKDYPEQVGLTSYNGAKRGQHGGSLKQYAAVLGNGNFLLSCIAIGLHHVSRWGLLSFLPKFFTDTTGWNVKKAGLMATALPLGMVVGALSGGYLSDRVFKGKRAPIICISLILCAIFTLLIPYVVLGDSSANPNENGASINNVNQNHEETAGKVVLSSSRKTMTIVILLLAGYFLYVSIGPFFSLCPDLLGVENSGTGIGVMDAAAYGFAALGTASIGAIVDYRGYGLAFWFMAGCALAGSFCIILVKENKENFYVQTN